MRYSSTQSLFCALTFAFSHLPLALAFEQCYYADGSIPTDYFWEPCVSQTNANVSSCCVPSEGDICQPNGLCFYPGAGADGNGATYRGTCTDRTWNDPACNADICLTGFENTWIWAEECKSGNQITWNCGNTTGGTNNYALPCSGNEVAFTDWVTTTSTTSVGRYTPPPSVNTKLFTVMTSSYTVTMTANGGNVPATLTTTFESTFTSALSSSTSGSTAAAATSNSPSTSNSPTQNTKKSGLSLGAIIAIIAIPVVLIALAIGLFFFFRAKRSKGEDPIRLNSAVPPPPPPPNGPVGADQVYPYEAAGNEVNRPQHNYYGPKVDTYEIDDRNAVLRGEKSPAVYGGNGYQNGGGQQRVELNSPAPAYSYGGPFAVEMDATPVVRHQAP